MRNGSPLTARFDTAETHPVAWTGLHGSSTALALIAAAQASDTVTLVIMRSSHQARVLERDLGLLRTAELPVLHFPDRETLPYDPFSAHPDIVAERLAALAAVAGLERGILVLPITTLAQRLAPRSHVLGTRFDLVPGQRLALEPFRERLLLSGYEACDQVYQSGQFAVRGSVVDVFPTGLKAPVRIDLFDEEIESLRLFDPESQRSAETLDTLNLAPAREYPCDTAAFEAFRRAFRYRFAVDTRQVPLYQDLRQGTHPQGLEQYLPLFFEDTEHLLDYLPRAPRLVLQDGVEAALSAFWEQVEDRWEQRRHDTERPILEPRELFYSPAETLGFCIDLPQVRLAPGPLRGAVQQAFDTEPPPEVHLHERGHQPAAALQAFLEDYPGRVLFAADTPGRREFLADTLSAFDIRPPRFESWEAFLAASDHRGLAVLPLETGFRVGDELAILTESE
ncbi:MAG TPA: transcription-repair coupling factor, partial [Xanthomonadales bacterium]|nr:transcription-repair coupling factor [Xanthomonadales bacterium]